MRFTNQGIKALAHRIDTTPSGRLGHRPRLDLDEKCVVVRERQRVELSIHLHALVHPGVLEIAEHSCVGQCFLQQLQYSLFCEGRTSALVCVPAARITFIL